MVELEAEKQNYLKQKRLSSDKRQKKREQKKKKDTWLYYVMIGDA